MVGQADMHVKKGERTMLILYKEKIPFYEKFKHHVGPSTIPLIACPNTYIRVLSGPFNKPKFIALVG